MKTGRVQKEKLPQLLVFHSLWKYNFFCCNKQQFQDYIWRIQRHPSKLFQIYQVVGVGFAIVAFYSISLGYWWLVFGSSSLVTAQLRILAFVCFSSHHRLLKHSLSMLDLGSSKEFVLLFFLWILLDNIFNNVKK